MEERWKVSYFYRSIHTIHIFYILGMSAPWQQFLNAPVRINDLLSCFEKSIALYCKSAHILFALFRSKPKRYYFEEWFWDGQTKTFGILFTFYIGSLEVSKVKIFWKGRKIFEKSPPLFWHWQVIFKRSGGFFQILSPSHNIGTLLAWSEFQYYV